MAKLIINTGSSPNDGTGDSLRTGANKINSNFNEIYTTFGDGTSLTTNSLIGTQGIKGNNGLQGVQGKIGIQGIQGKVGSSFIVIGSEFDVNISPPGNPQTFLNNAYPNAVPGNAVIDLITKNIWQYEGLGIWINYGSIGGPQGLQGIQGVQGIDGLYAGQGTQGLQGSQGGQGIQGIDGLYAGQGTQGTQGTQGIQGFPGGSIPYPIFTTESEIIYSLYVPEQNSIVLASSPDFIIKNRANDIFNDPPITFVGIGTTNSDYRLTVGGDIRAGIGSTSGVILTSPNGSLFRLTVDDFGVLSTNLVV